MPQDNIIKKVCKELGITQKELENLSIVAKELPPLWNSLRLVEFELGYMKINSSLYKAVKSAREEVEKIIHLNQGKVAATLLDGDKNDADARLGDKSSHT